MVGHRMRDRREGEQMTQEQLGRKLGELLGKAWSRQTVSAAEQGKRAFTAAELVAIAHALGTSVGRLLTPPPGVGSVVLPGGAEVSRADLVAAVLPLLSAERAFGETYDTVGRLAQHLDQVTKGAVSLGGDLSLLTEQIFQAAEIATIRTKNEDGLG